MPQYVTLGPRPIGWVFLLGCLGAAGFAFRASEFWTGVGFVAYSMLGAYILVGVYGRYAVDEVALYAITSLGWHYRMAWVEVQYVECGAGGTLVFHGANKRFVLPHASCWYGEHKPATYQRLVTQFESRKITPVPSSTADYQFNKNVRVDNAA